MSTNGWGKASINNSNGFGDGAINNTNGWGDSQLRSWSGDTDIDGGTGIPVNTVAPVISGATTLGSVLSTTNGTWTAKPAATFTYQWKRNGSNIIGATNSTYTLVNEDGATNITCQVTATNDFGSANATSNTLAIPAFTDADAQAFITAASITDPTQQAAINQLVVDLKGYNVWSKMKALYPFVGGTASQHKWNLKDPRDLDAAFRLVFNGGGTHSVNGYQPNGVNGSADTFYNPSILGQLNSAHLSYYSRTNNTIDSQVEMGAFPQAHFLSYRFYSGQTYGGINSSDAGVNPFTPTTGLFIGSRISSTTAKFFRAGNLIVTDNKTSTTSPNLNLRIGALNNGGAIQLHTSKECAFASIGDGLTDTEAANFYTAVQSFQVSLNRQV